MDQNNKDQTANTTTKALAIAEGKWKQELKASSESYRRRITTLNKIVEEKLDIQQKSLQEQINKSIETAELQSKQTALLSSTQVNHTQKSVDKLTNTLNAFMLQMSGGPTLPFSSIPTKYLNFCCIFPPKQRHKRASAS
eukprot:scaffold83261_cov25-Attheya_sp.AAC.1